MEGDGGRGGRRRTWRETEGERRNIKKRKKGWMA